MADDILLTQEQQDERARQWFKDNGPSLLVGIVLGLGLVFGYNYYKDKRDAALEQASFLYANIVSSLEDSNLADISDSLNELKTNHADSSYASKATLLKARQLVVSDTEAAIEQLQWVLEHAKEIPLQHAARLRLAKIYLAENKIEKAEQIAQYKNTSGYVSQYLELSGDVAAKQNKQNEAREFYQKALDELPASQFNYQAVLSFKLNRFSEVSE